MIRVSSFDHLTEKDISEINRIYDSVDFSKGIMSPKYHGHDIKNNLEIDGDDPYYAFCSKPILSAITKDYNFFDYSSSSPFKITPFIFSQYTDGMFYDLHNDAYSMRSNKVRTDWSCTLFLNDPSEYEGGELMIDIGDREIPYKLKAGEYVLYPTGLSHRVNVVKSGKRRVCVFWVQSYISDYRIRTILTDFSLIRERYLDKWIEEDPWIARMFAKILYDLKRNFYNS